MNDEPGAASLFSAGLSRIADAAGLTLVAVLAWRMFFAIDASLQTGALAVGLLGLTACWTDRHAIKTIPAALVAFAGVGLTSTALNRWAAVSAAAAPDWSWFFAPAFHLVVMTMFVYGAAYLLRTPARLSLLVVLLIVSSGVLATQILFDRATAGFVYERGGTLSTPSIPQWGGIQGTSLLLTLAIGFTLAVPAVSRSMWRVMAGLVLAGGLLLVGYINSSAGGLIAMATAGVAAALFMLRAHVRSVRRQVLLVLLGATIVGSLFIVMVAAKEEPTSDARLLSGRTVLWDATWKLALDRPWLGVGAGNYALAMSESHHADAFRRQYGVTPPNAHNMLMHVGAELGGLGVLSLVLLLLWAFRACWRAWVSQCAPFVSAGVLLALTGLVAHSLSEHFLDARQEVERTRLLIWLLFAAALALERLPRLTASAQS